MLYPKDQKVNLAVIEQYYNVGLTYFFAHCLNVVRQKWRLGGR